MHDIGNSMTSVSVYTFTVVPCSLCMGCEGKQFERLRQGSQKRPDLGGLACRAKDTVFYLSQEGPWGARSRAPLLDLIPRGILTPSPLGPRVRVAS